MRKPTVTEKHIEAVTSKNILVDFPLYGNVRFRLFGRVVGRMRNRFKQYIFVPTIPFSSLYFSAGDVEAIEPDSDFGFIVKLKNSDNEPKKRRRKKKPVLKEVAAETTIDLSTPPSCPIPLGVGTEATS